MTPYICSLIISLAVLYSGHIIGKSLAWRRAYEEYETLLEANPDQALHYYEDVLLSKRFEKLTRKTTFKNIPK